MFAATRAETAGRGIGAAGVQRGLLTHRLPTVEAVGHFETRCQIPTKRRKRVTGDAPIEREEEEVGAHAYAGKAILQVCRRCCAVEVVRAWAWAETVEEEAKRDRRGMEPAWGWGAWESRWCRRRRGRGDGPGRGKRREGEERRVGVECRADGALLEVEGTRTRTRTDERCERVAARLHGRPSGQSARALSILRRHDQGAGREQHLRREPQPEDVKLCLRRHSGEPTAHAFCSSARPSQCPLTVYTRGGRLPRGSLSALQAKNRHTPEDGGMGWDGMGACALSSRPAPTAGQPKRRRVPDFSLKETQVATPASTQSLVATVRRKTLSLALRPPTNLAASESCVWPRSTRTCHSEPSNVRQQRPT